jgi:ATP-dependent Clp protease ATP-binding subunit ClpC
VCTVNLQQGCVHVAIEQKYILALQVLHGLAIRYEDYHRVSFSPAALEAAVQLSARYIPDRHLPDKAIDLIDEAGSRARITAYYSRKANLDEPDFRLAELSQVC